jgi:hypothetical protein
MRNAGDSLTQGDTPMTDLDAFRLPEPTAKEKLAKIQAHLSAGGQVMIVTYARGTLYKKKHLAMFTATDTDLFVARGKHKDCLTYTCIKFSR